MAELNKRSMEKSMTQMKHTMKPTLITMLPLILVFTWLRAEYTVKQVAFLGITSWLWIYIIFSLVISITIRKLLKVH
jgi:uncharacterized membrane protein (DUF106 family)